MSRRTTRNLLLACGVGITLGLGAVGAGLLLGLWLDELKPTRHQIFAAAISLTVAGLLTASVLLSRIRL